MSLQHLQLSLDKQQLGGPAPACMGKMQAHFINNRSMEIFRPLDGLAAEVAAHSPPLAEWRKFVYCESLTGRIFGEVDHFQVRISATCHALSV